MADLRVQFPDDFLARLRSYLGADTKATEIVKDALTVYAWAAEERSKGRLILSSNSDGADFVRLAMPSLDQAARRTYTSAPAASTGDSGGFGLGAARGAAAAP